MKHALVVCSLVAPHRHGGGQEGKDEEAGKPEYCMVEYRSDSSYEVENSPDSFLSTLDFNTHLESKRYIDRFVSPLSRFIPTRMMSRF